MQTDRRKTQVIIMKIALCGFMGCGKTTVAKTLSEKYDLPHIDIDKFIEEKHNITISEMFGKFGEEYFRDKEYDAICELARNGNSILALGGGAVMFEKNVKALKENGYKIVFIDTDLDVIKERLKNDTSRPLIKSSDITELYNKRIDTYNAVCDVKITTKYETAEIIADMITKKA